VKECLIWSLEKCRKLYKVFAEPLDSSLTCYSKTSKWKFVCELLPSFVFSL